MSERPIASASRAVGTPIWNYSTRTVAMRSSETRIRRCSLSTARARPGHGLEVPVEIQSDESRGSLRRSFREAVSQSGRLFSAAE